MRTRITAPLAILIALAVTPALAGCFGNPVESIIEGATGGNVDLGGAKVPDDYPTDKVPLIDGEVVYGLGLGKDGAKAWNVTIKVSGIDAVDTIKSQLTAVGFTQTDAPVGGKTGDGATLILESADYGALVVVSKDGKNGFVANYTVTDKSE
jgi:hypothetical protein